MSYLTEDQFRQYMEVFSKAPELTVDTEGTLTHPHSETWGVSISYGGIAEYFAFNHMLGQNLPGEWLSAVVKVLENCPQLNFHHAKHDLKALRNLGLNYTGKFYDTMLMQHMVNENLYSKELDALAVHYKTERKRNDSLMKDLIKGFGWDYVPVEIIRPYGANDAYITEVIKNLIQPDFEAQGFDGELWDWEQRFCRLLMKIEDNGILINQDLSQQQLEIGLKTMSAIEKRLGFNPGSPVQLGNFLLEELKVPPVGEKGKSGRYSFNKENMKVYDELLALRNDETAKLILTYRGWQKTCSSNYKAYLELLRPDGRIRCNYKQHGTDTGRLSCEKPNLQQIPKVSDNPWNGHLKDAFIVEEGRTAYELDYSQLEFRLGAAYGKEKKLLEIFNDDSRDIFSEMAADLHMTRNQTKTLNYSIQYGAGVNRIKNVFGVTDNAAKAILTNYYRQYQGLAKVSTFAKNKCIERGYVQYWTGRRRHFVNPSKQAHKAFNAAIQGGAFEIVKRAMVKVDEAGLNNDECKIDLQVHDSIRVDIVNGKEAEYLPEIKRVMEDTPDFGVKFRVDVKRWGEKG